VRGQRDAAIRVQREVLHKTTLLFTFAAPKVLSGTNTHTPEAQKKGRTGTRSTRPQHRSACRGSKLTARL
jgi:hypothetical protein